MEFSPVQYARQNGTSVAYRLVGSGPIDIVWIGGWATNAETWDEAEPELARAIERVARFSRLILFDRRGVGLSDPIAIERIPSLEAWMDDLTSVIDDVGSERVVLVGHGQGGQMAALFAATHPRRAHSLILTNAYARLAAAPDYPQGIPPNVQEKILQSIAATWGTGASVARLAPSVANDAQVRRWMGKLERLSASPSAAVELNRAIFRIDIRSVLSSINVPTLILHSVGDCLISVEHGRYLAGAMPNARFVEGRGNDDWWWHSDRDLFLSEIEEFVTGKRPQLESERVLATVLFTDIVGSTEHAIAVGDKKWRGALDEHDAITERNVHRYRGEVINRAGDGMMARFDGPARAVQCARAILREVHDRTGLRLRAGLHTGEVELRGDEIGGLAVHLAARVSAKAGPDEVFVSRTVTDLVVGSDLEFKSCGEHELKGFPGSWELFCLT